MVPEEEVDSTFSEIPSNERENMILVCSGLKTINDRTMYNNFIKKFDMRQKNAIDKNVTHLGNIYILREQNSGPF